MARPEKFRLGEILVQQGLLSNDQLNKALELQKATGKKLGRVFVEAGYVSERQISEAIARQLQVPFVDLKFFNVKPEVVRVLPEAQARRFRSLVLEDRGDSYLVGMVDPIDIFAYDELTRLLNKDITLAVVTESDVLMVIDRIYRRTEEIKNLSQALEQDLGSDAFDLAALGLTTQGTEDAPVVRLLQSIFEDAMQVRASDIHIEPQEGKLQIRFRIDGVMHLQTEADVKIATALVLRLKLMSGLDISEKRLPQDGRFNMRLRNQQVDVRISTMPTQYGESVVMRLLVQSGAMISLEKLGMPPAMLERFRKLIHRPSGMVLVTGPTGSGKTTTLYAALAELNSPANKIITVEDPVEYRLPGITQVQVNEKIDLDFSRVLRSVLRHDPDIVLVGEMRDHETAQIGLRAAMTGHLVLSTLHTNDAVSTPIRLVDMGVPRFMVGTSLLGVVAQRLVRTICESCAEPYTPLPYEREWLKLELKDEVDAHRYLRGRGCQHCNGSGYLGRIGVYELLEMSEPLIEAASHHEPTHFVKVARQALGRETMRRHSVDLVLAGRVTIAEAMRICNQFED
ncbi:MAG: GspE/PulE family protein [Methylophilaceae bacterium]|nr:GspE/PulE family protein [Methylophilaceae bacterium]